MKLLFLDIETSPIVAHVWALWDQNVGLNQIMQPSMVMCWAARWAGEKEVMFASVHDREAMVRRMHALLDEADAVCHYNGERFDVPNLNREFIEQGLAPPSPYRQIDLLRTARRQFKFPSNKLQYVATTLGVGQKVKHEGHTLWIKCMANDPKAWAMMERYNKADVTLLEKLYKRLLPWIKGHPNVGLHDDTHSCPQCGSEKYQKRGFAYTAAFRYQKYQCKTCESWFRDAATSKPVARNKFVKAQ